MELFVVDRQTDVRRLDNDVEERNENLTVGNLVIWLHWPNLDKPGPINQSTHQPIQFQAYYHCCYFLPELGSRCVPAG